MDLNEVNLELFTCYCHEVWNLLLLIERIAK
jgi:hypothetical protein